MGGAHGRKAKHKENKEETERSDNKKRKAVKGNQKHEVLLGSEVTVVDRAADLFTQR